MHMLIYAARKQQAFFRRHILCLRIHHHIFRPAVPAHDSGDFSVLDQDVAGEYLPFIYNSGVVDVIVVPFPHVMP